MLRIISFTSHKHPILRDKIFELTNPKENKSKNYYSIVIGPNGMGKSYMLTHLIEAFNEIALLKTNEDYKPKIKFTLVFSIDKSIFRISTKNPELILEKNNLPTELSKIRLPSKWLASSVTINDKYPILNYIRKQQIPQYKYLGIRSASNNAFVSRITINTVLYLLDSLKKKKTKKLLSVYKSLSLNPELHVVFTGGPMLKLNKKRGEYYLFNSIEKLVDPHRFFLRKNKSKTSYRADNYKKHLENKTSLLSALDFMTSKQSMFEKSSKSSMKLTYTINLETKKGINEILSDWPTISILLDLELIKINKFLITKSNAFKYEEASSGESHLLTSLHGIIANTEDNSLVIIDEPEVSLHPNWQIDYIEILKSIFNDYKGINIVISSHSHLLVSSLKNEESRISSITKNKANDEIKIEELDFETYGWDPESILYNVFEVVTMRNKYFELDLRKLISLISTKSEKKNEIERLKNKLSKYIMANQDDPLRLVINQAENYIKM